MEDQSVLLIKPEIIKKIGGIKRSLKKRGYHISAVVIKNNWRKVIYDIYPEFTLGELRAFEKGYDLHRFGNRYALLFLHHKNGNTIMRLEAEKGNYISYQTHRENTLRAEFGLNKDYNESYFKRIFTYNGMHTPKDKKEFDQMLQIIGKTQNSKILQRK